MRRTLEIARKYDGPHDATLLINCMLGLLVVPKEQLIDRIPAAPFESLAEWGIQPGSIRNFGRCENGHQQPPNLRQLVRRMRNAVAHFNIDPFPSGDAVQGFVFKDRSGFDAQITLSELNEFVVKLAAHLERAA